MINNESLILRVLDDLDWQPIDPNHKISVRSRLVHDLGIAGDDFDELLQLLEERAGPPRACLDADFVPSELSADSYHVAMARRYLACWFPHLRRRHVARIMCPEITVGEIEETLFGNHGAGE